jgi:hypothetical protein
MSQGRSARRWDRHAVTIPITISLLLDGQPSKLRAQASDVSKGGLSLFITRDIPIGVSLLVDFVLPYHSTPLALRSVVRTRSGFNYGIEFLSPTPEEQEIIERTCRVFTLLS